MISFQPTDDQKLMLESVGQFARTTIRPKFRESETKRGLSGEILKAASELGLGLAPFSEAAGGAGLGMVTAVLLEEELAWADPGAAFALPGPGAFGFAVTELGSADQAAAALAAFGTDPTRIGAVAWGEARANKERAGFTTTAASGGAGSWTLTGTKSYVLNADRAASFVVFAQTDGSKGWGGIDAFVVDASLVNVGPRVTTLGLDAASFGSITLENVVVPESARLQRLDVQTMCTFFAKNALVVAARAVGLSRGAFEATREYVDTRKAFGKPIGHFQAVAFNVADRAMDVDAARALVWRAAAAWDAADKDALLLSAQAIAFAHEAAMRCGDDGVQLHGGAGFMRDYAVEKFMRDAKQIGLCGMTAEHADQLAAALALGVPLDPALVLPTPDTQNVFV
jgi:alkylation response protein AidB-like acyl-CoA dehydrogenase